MELGAKMLNEEEKAILVSEINNTLVLPNISDWEKGFLNSILARVERGWALSDPQNNTFNKIKNNNVEQDNSWIENDPEYAQKRHYAILHYGATEYYRNTIKKMVENPNYIPQKAQWDKMWGNKYINAGYKRHNEGPHFDLGEIVINKYIPDYYGKAGTISAVNWDIHSHNWSYDVLFFNGTNYKNMNPKMLLKMVKRNMNTRGL